MTWFVFALLSAVFAALTSILAKVGIIGVNSNLATAIRTIVITFFAWGIVFFQGSIKEVGGMSRHTLIFLVLSGLTTGLSWLFYFRALQIGSVSKVVPIDKLSLVLAVVLGALLLGEKVTPHIVIGSLLMVMGAILVAF